MIVRNASTADLPDLRDLYNALIPSTTVAWTETRETLRQRQTWFRAQQRNGHPVLVAVVEGVVVGFCSYGSFRGAGRWPGYRHTVEHTIHVARSSWGAGVGRALIAELVKRAGAAGIHVMVAAIDSDNTASIQFHERLGFSKVAVLPEVGRKFDRWLDLVLMQRIIESTP